MRSLEEEKREVALQLLEMERTLYRTKEHYERQVESMRSENEKALLQTQLESEQLQSEYQVLQKEKAARIQELESELTALQEQSVSEVETMQARVADLEQRNQGFNAYRLYATLPSIHTYSTHMPPCWNASKGSSNSILFASYS